MKEKTFHTHISVASGRAGRSSILVSVPFVTADA